MLELARDLVQTKLGQYDAVISERLEERAENAMLKTGWIVAPLMIVPFVLWIGTSFLRALHVPLPGMAWLDFIAPLVFLAGFGTLIVARLTVRRALFVTQLLPDGAAAVVARALVVAFDKAHPDHAFRLIALYLFVAGFQLDLLAS
ncbi:hypothetical protein [Nonomuraea polychroma]|uniref:hypothetical protein n=1 Tax=Nonomuraea polychroma TaxID=46176 RepID=UPI000FDD2228|nr:hypothetical protein [Nonomuraea polychroma]